MIYFSMDIENVNTQKHGKQTESARQLLLAGLRLEYGLDKLPEIAVDEWGKPFFSEKPSIFFNYSHCRSGILCGISNRKIGVDIETPRVFREAVIARICHQKELEEISKWDDVHHVMTKLWVAKEAFLKYRGTGIRSDLRQLDMSAILYGDVQNFDGSTMRLWEQQGHYMCACAEQKKDLQLQFIEI